MSRNLNGNGTKKKAKSSIKKIVTLIIFFILIATVNFVNDKLPKEISISSIEDVGRIINDYIFNESSNDVDGDLESSASVESDVDISPEALATSEEQAEEASHEVFTLGEYDDSVLEVYFFDVGQADSILLMTDGKAMLIDTGNAGDATEKNKLEEKINLTYELNRLGVDYIDILVATHPHEDHMGSMYKIVKTFEIGDLYINPPREEDMENRYYERFIEAINEKNIHLISPTTLTEKELIERVNEYNAKLGEDDEKLQYNAEDYIRVGDVIEFGDAKITLLAPNSAEYSDTNDYSIVFMVEFEGRKLLLTGDAGKESEEEMLRYAKESGFNLDCDILKVGHHGSRTASTEDFIATVDPEYAIIMVGEKSKYDLPDEEPIEYLKKYGATIYQTIEEGDIKLTIDNGEYEFDLNFTHHEKEPSK